MVRRFVVFGIAAVLVVAALMVFAARDRAASAVAPPFAPGATLCLEVLETNAFCDGSSVATEATDLRSQFCVGWGPACQVQPSLPSVQDSLYGLVVFFTPAGWVPPSASSVPVGAIAGQLTSNQALGLLNNPCNTQIQVRWSLMVASVDFADTVDPKPVGQVNPFEPLALDGNSDGVPDGADKYPAFLNTLFSNAQPEARLLGISKIQGLWSPINIVFFEPGETVSIAGRSLNFDSALGQPGIAVIQNPTLPESPGPISDVCAPQNNSLVLLGKTLNNPCTPVLPDNPAKKTANCPLPEVGGSNQSTQNAGYPFFPCEGINSFDEDSDGVINDGCPQVNQIAEADVECENNTSDDGEDSAVNDGCPVSGDVSEGSRMPGACSGTDEGGCVFRQNPLAGAHRFTIWTESHRDADNDGTENPLDVCSIQGNGDWNPRTFDAVNDIDQDGLPNACDPDPDVKSGQSPLTCVAGIVGDDEDKDCLSNRQDNCPTDNQLLNPGAPPDLVNVPNAVDGDGDGIGDACDPSPLSPNGDLASICLWAILEVGQPAAPVIATEDPIPGPACVEAGLFGDVDCGGAVNSVDALKVLRHSAGLPNSLPPGCIFNGDVDCSGVTNSVDALRLLRHSAGLPNLVPKGCFPIGS